MIGRKRGRGAVPGLGVTTPKSEKGVNVDGPPVGLWAAGAGTLIAIVVTIVLLLGGDDNASVDLGWLKGDASGDIVYCSGEDVSGSQHRSVEDFNQSSEADQSEARLVDNFASSPTAEGQRREYLDRIDKAQCDVVYLDVIYMAEFASKGLLRDMSDYLDSRDGAEIFDDRMMRTVAYEDKLWGVPKQLDGGVIFYRNDAEERPESWQDILARARPEAGQKPGLRLQLDAYEGLTVVFLELAFAAGAEQIVSEDGRTANIDQPQAMAALRFMRDAIRTQAVPGTVTRLGDAGSFYVFSSGRARFLRSWPYVQPRFLREAQLAAARGNATAPARYKTARNLGVVPLPPWQAGGPSIGVLGGHNLVIPRSSKNPEAALRLVDFLTSSEQVLRDARSASLAPVLSDAWRDPDVQADPALSAVNDMELRLRPVLPTYAEVSEAIYTTLRRVLRTQQSDESLARALKNIDDDIQAVLDG